MRIKVMNGRELAYEATAHMVVMPGLDGEFSILDFHQSVLYRLRRGIIKIQPELGIHKFQEEEEEEKMFHIKDGLARFSGNSLLILCEIG